MSDLTEWFGNLVNPNDKDPKRLTTSQFIAKEEANIANGVSKLPPAIQPFVQVAGSSAEQLAKSAIEVESSALGAYISKEAPNVEAFFLDFLGKAVGGKNAEEINALASSPGGQTAINQTAQAAVALVTHLASQASAGVLGLTTPPPSQQQELPALAPGQPRTEGVG